MCVWGSFLVFHPSLCKMCIQHIPILPTKPGPVYSSSNGDPNPAFPILEWREAVGLRRALSEYRKSGRERAVIPGNVPFTLILLAEPSWIKALRRSVCNQLEKQPENAFFFCLAAFPNPCTLCFHSQENSQPVPCGWGGKSLLGGMVNPSWKGHGGARMIWALISLQPNLFCEKHLLI